MKPTLKIMSMNKLSNLPETELAGQVVFMRAALNAPIEDGEITTDFRLQSILATVKLLRDAGAKVILAGHLSGSDTDSFQDVYEYFQKQFPLKFITKYAEGEAKATVNSMKNGDVVLLENLRQHPGEKANDSSFAEMLADYGDLYVNEAFPAAHRKHASIVGLPQLLPAYAGLQFEKEVNYLSKAFDPEHPFVFILGGAKFATKIPLVEKFISSADDVFVGGAVANAYLKAAGNTVGQSRLPEREIDLSDGLKAAGLQLPDTVVCENENGQAVTKPVDKISSTETIVDVGSDFTQQITSAAETAEMVVWNGPMGWYEKGYTQATDQLASSLAQVGGQTILGGGDTAAVILDGYSADDFGFVSTAGGAMIQFLAEETLPGIEVLE